MQELKVKYKEIGKITGAYVLIKKLKDRLKTFDSALELMDQNKSSLNEFRALEAKVREN